MPEWKTVAAIVEAIPSWVTQDEAAYLFSLVKPKDVCVDVGGGRGKSAIVMALAANRVVRVVSLWNEPSEGTQDEMMNHAFASHVSLWGREEDSCSVAADIGRVGATCDVVFIDADHSYEAVKADILGWSKVVKPGGILAFHDCDSDVHPGVSKAIAECMTWPKVGQVGSLAAYRRPQ